MSAALARVSHHAQRPVQVQGQAHPRAPVQRQTTRGAPLQATARPARGLPKPRPPIEFDHTDYFPKWKVHEITVKRNFSTLPADFSSLHIAGSEEPEKIRVEGKHPYNEEANEKNLIKDAPQDTVSRTNQVASNKLPLDIEKALLTRLSA